jgi:3-oxoacyl-(acyl-carrier-protein) synthase III
MADNEYSIVIPMPFNGESIVDGIIVSWMVKAGTGVRKGQPLAEIETEKSVWQFESPCDGEVVALAAKEGDVVDVGAPLVEIRTADPDMKHLAKGGTAKAEQPKPTAPAPLAKAVDDSTASALLRTLSPRIRKMVADAAIPDADLLRIARETADGRITAAEIGRYLDEEEAKKASSGGLRTCYVAGLGTYVPARIVGNDHFIKQFTDIDADYIEKVTGIRERHWAEKETTSDLGTEAAKAALENAGMTAADIELIIVSTTTPDMPLPASANAIQQKLGCPLIPAFDLSAACSGWLYALSIGRQFVQTGTYGSVLVIAAEEMSKFTDKTDRATAFLFGDGAGAVVLSSRPNPKTGKGHVLSDMILRADSSGYDIIHRKAGGSEFPPGSGLEVADGFWFMDGGRMFRTAVEAFSGIIEAVALESGTSLGDFAWIVPHQANQRILKSVAHKLKLPIEKFFVNIEKYGNTSAASIPLALKDLEATGSLKPGDRILICAVGAGLTIAGGTITW